MTIQNKKKNEINLRSLIMGCGCSKNKKVGLASKKKSSSKLKNNTIKKRAANYKLRKKRLVAIHARTKPKR